jgi:hypothetical protein
MNRRTYCSLTESIAFDGGNRLSSTVRRPDLAPEHFASYFGGRFDALRGRGNFTGILEDASVEGDYLRVLTSVTRFSGGPGKPFSSPDSCLVEHCFDISFATVSRGISGGDLHITLVEDGLHTTLSCKLPQHSTRESRHLQLVPAR